MALSWELTAFEIIVTSAKYLGAAHNECNLNFSFTGRIPVILHNLRGYNTEKYISFSIDNLDFIDSLQFMNVSLDKLVFNVTKDCSDKFPILKQQIDSDKIPLLRKGVYPYDYMDCAEV